MATGKLLAQLASIYESETGQQVLFESVGGVDAARRVASGEAFDIVVLAANAIDALACNGVLLENTRRDVVRSTTAIAIPAGAPPPSIESASALREAIKASTGVGYSTGPSGQAIVQLLAQWGITGDSDGPKLVQAKPGSPVGRLIAAGEVSIGFQQLSELINLPGIQVLGPMPPGLEIETVFTGAVCSSSTAAEKAQHCLQFLCSPETAAQKQRHGMAAA